MAWTISRNGGLDQRDEIREAFADARSGFHGEMVRLLDRFGDRHGHFELLRPRLIRELLP